METVHIRRQLRVPQFQTVVVVFLSVFIISQSFFAAGRIVHWVALATTSSSIAAYLLAAKMALRWAFTLTILFTIVGTLIAFLKRVQVRVNVRGVGYAYFAYWTWFLSTICIVAWNDSKQHPSARSLFSGVIVGVIGFKLVARGSRMFKVAQQYMIRSADDALQMYKRSPILYLRSFRQDYMANEMKESYRISRPTFWTDSRELTIEEIFCRGLAKVSLVVAIGQPGERLPKLGALRKYVSNEEWQQEVLRLMSISSLICLAVGSSEGLMWEFQKCLEHCDSRRLLLLIPGGAVTDGSWKEFTCFAEKTSWAC